MCVELLMRSQYYNGTTSKTYLGCGSGDKKKGFNIILQWIGGGQYRRVVNKEYDFEVIDLNSLNPERWSLKDVFIPNPSPVPPAQSYPDNPKLCYGT
jgi:hypothetical protein